MLPYSSCFLTHRKQRPQRIIGLKSSSSHAPLPAIVRDILGKKKEKPFAAHGSQALML